MPSQPFGCGSQSEGKEKTLEPAPPKAITTEEKENAVSGRPAEELRDRDGGMQDPRLLPPQTPGRISLSDLVANPEDLLNQLPSATPHEQVTWKHVPGLLNSPSSSVRTTQRGTKRSHSSSPASSQGRRSKHFRADRDAMDMKIVSQSLQKSPARPSPNHDDPAAMLWSNYAEKRALAPASRALFLNTDTIASPEPATELLTGSNQRITNPTESVLTSHLLTTLIRSGVPPKSIGIITFYRSQLSLLRRDVKAIAGSAAASDVEMHTADKYQGRDKEVILLSCVRSNPSHNVGELLKDWRRVNVAITRARTKLIILGSKSTLEGSGVPVLQGLVRIMGEKSWTYDLPNDATEVHAFETVGMTQSQAAPEPSKPAVTSQRVGVVAVEAKKPLQSVNANPRALTSTHAGVGAKLYSPNKAKAPFKVPKKVVKGAFDVENVLDRRPILRDIAKEMAPSKVDMPAVAYDLDDFDDDMLIDF